jgi:DNA gyrase subunit A
LIMVGSEHGYGKLTPIADFPQHGRGGQGVIAMQTTDRNGRLVGAQRVTPDNEVMLISSNGTLVRTPVSDISVQGRNTQGVRLIRLDDGDRLVGLERIEGEGGEPEGGE